MNDLYTVVILSAERLLYLLIHFFIFTMIAKIIIYDLFIKSLIILVYYLNMSQIISEGNNSLRPKIF